jgi:hypothetical protein
LGVSRAHEGGENTQKAEDAPQIDFKGKSAVYAVVQQ